ncbi:outer membrane lipoprotein-sorting protein [bacterium]|nr:outer membrane lipoprotein-sorting protein [bacterium]
MKKIKVFLVFTLIFVAFFVVAPSKADEQVENIFNNIKNINKGLVDYQANIDIQLQARLAFIPYNPAMSGSYYYKAPEKHKLVLEKAPSYLKKYPNIFGWHLPKIEKFNSRVTETIELEGQKVWHILMLPKQGMGDIISVEMWVNCKDYTVPRQVTNYKNDGRLSVNVQYTTIEGYKVFDKMSAQFVFPKVAVNANATAKYSNYKFNNNLPDSFFEKEKK